MECSGYGAARWAVPSLRGLRGVQRIASRQNCGVVRCEKKEKSAVIVGAGPAGALLAVLLARQDWKVDVFERKAFRAGRFDGGGEGWNVMLGARAAHSVDSVGLKDAVARGRAMLRSHRHRR